MNEFKITCSIAKAYEKSDGKTVRRFIGGLASGTQVDLEGERMAESAIEAFQKAIRDGVHLPDGQWSLIPLRSGHRHEWDDVLGWIVGADVDKTHNLWIEAELDQENPVAMSLYRKLTRNPEHGKPVKLGLSVGGTVVKAGYEPSEDGNSFVKTYYDVDLREVSVVSQPAYPTSYLMALQKSVDWDKLAPAGEPLVKTPSSADEPTQNMDSLQETTMENELIVNELEKAQLETETESVAEVEKTETHESEPAEAEVTKAGLDNARMLSPEEAAERAEGEGAPEADVSIDALVTRLNSLTATVEKIAAQLGVVRAADEADTGEPVTKAIEADDSKTAELVKTAVLAVMAPVLERLDRIENEPVDKSYAVLRSKYEDEPFETRIQREINAVDGRDAVKRALELAFKAHQ